MSGRRMTWRPEGVGAIVAELTPLEALKRQHESVRRDMNQSVSDPERFETMARLAAELDAEIRRVEGNPRPPINLDDEGDVLIVKMALDALVEKTSGVQLQALKRGNYGQAARIGSFMASVIAMKRVLP